MLVCQFKFFKETDSKYNVIWTLVDENENVIDSGQKPYQPMHGPIATMNEAKRKIGDALYAQMLYAHPGQRFRVLCTNPKSDFLSKSEMYRLNHGLAVEEPKPATVVPATEQLYEVVEVEGIWTIKKHNTPYFTETEAKTELFKRIVNGE